MKFGKRLRENAVPEWNSAYIDYKSLKRLIKAIKAERQAAVDRTREALPIEYRPAAPEPPPAAAEQLLARVLQPLTGSSRGVPPSVAPGPGTSPRPPTADGIGADMVPDPAKQLARRRNRFCSAVKMVSLWRSWASGNSERPSPAEAAFLEALESETRKAANFYVAKSEQIQGQYADIRRQIAAYQRAGNSATVEARRAILETCVKFVRVLDMLENRFRLLNVMAATKAVKKYDKVTRRRTLASFRAALDQMPGLSSDLLEHLRSDITALVGPPRPGPPRPPRPGPPRPAASSKSGASLNLERTPGPPTWLNLEDEPKVALAREVDEPLLRAVFPVFRGLCVLVAYLWCFGAIVFVMGRARINYRFILDIAPDVALDHHVLFQNCALLTAALFLAFWMFYSSISSGAALSLAAVARPQYIPLYVYAAFALLALAPRLQRTRHQYCGVLRWIVATLFRVWTAPFVEIRFRDEWLGDQMTSTVICMTDLFYTYCYYPTQLHRSPSEASSFCGSKALWTPVIASYPFLVRMLQCLRRAWDLRDVNPKESTTQIWNAVKYLTSILCVVIYAIYGHVHIHGELAHSLVLALFVVVSIWSTIMKIYWDIQLDWGMLQLRPETTASGKVREGGPEGYSVAGWHSALRRLELRPARIFDQAWVYYAAIAFNVFVRLTWVFQTNPALFSADMEGEAFKILLAVLETGRRAVWNLFRIEYEQLRNCASFRAFDVPLLFVPEEEDEEEAAAHSERLRRTAPARPKPDVEMVLGGSGDTSAAAADAGPAPGGSPKAHRRAAAKSQSFREPPQVHVGAPRAAQEEGAAAAAAIGRPVVEDPLALEAATEAARAHERRHRAQQQQAHLQEGREGGAAVDRAAPASLAAAE
eukprot:tig00000114_g6050.t1